MTGEILPYRRASLILVNCFPFGGGGWFPRLSNTGVIKPVISTRRTCGALATSTLQGFLVFFKFPHKITELDYHSGAPPSAHCPPHRAQCGSSATYCPLCGAVSAPQALQLCPVWCCAFCLLLFVLDWFLFLVVCHRLGRLFVSLVGCCFCHAVVPVRPVR